MAFAIGKFILFYFLPFFTVLYFLWNICEPYWFTHLTAIFGLSVIAWTVAYRIYESVNSGKQIVPNNKAVLITGCDTGFGFQLAKRLDQYGFHVFAGVLFPEKADELRAACSTRLRVLRMDVTNQAEVEAVVQNIEQSGLPLWAVVNNAGIGFGVPFDWGHDVDEHRKVLEVNVLGVVRVTKHCMPLLRRSKGRVVNVASAAGRISIPTMSHYCMAKHAVRAFSDTIRREVVTPGDSKSIDAVITIEPIFYRTEIINFEVMERSQKRIFDETPKNIQEVYGEKYLKKLAFLKKQVNQMCRSNLFEVIDAMETAVTAEHPKPYYRCCGYFDVLHIWACSHLPEIILDYFINLQHSIY